MRYILSICATAALAGCGGLQTSIPPHTAASQGHVTAPVGTKGKSLIYVGSAYCSASCSGSGDDSGEISVYTFPKGKFIGSWLGARGSYTARACADQTGDVFVTYNTYASSGSGEIVEFGHGDTTPVATLIDTSGYPVACSVDPTNGNLAVVNGGDSGTVLVYPKGSGNPTVYAASDTRLAGVGYDDQGNLFIDGLASPSDKFLAFAELPKGGSSFETITLDQKFEGAGEIQWDGKYITLGLGRIYRLTVHGSSAHVIGYTRLPHMARDGVVQYWIDGTQLAAARVRGPAICPPEGCGPLYGKVGVWSYPGGVPTHKAITPALEYPSGVAISLAQ